MTQKDQLKVLKQGFTIIRKDNQPNIRIKFKSGMITDFITYKGKFKTQVERDAQFEELLKNDYFIED